MGSTKGTFFEGAGSSEEHPLVSCWSIGVALVNLLIQLDLHGCTGAEAGYADAWAWRNLLAGHVPLPRAQGRPRDASGPDPRMSKAYNRTWLDNTCEGLCNRIVSLVALEGVVVMKVCPVPDSARYSAV